MFQVDFIGGKVLDTLFVPCLSGRDNEFVVCKKSGKKEIRDQHHKSIGEYLELLRLGNSERKFETKKNT